MIKPIVQEELLKGWQVDPETFFGTYNKKVGIQIDPVRNPTWINDPTIFKVALMVEPPEVNKGCVENYILVNWEKFDLILTYYSRVLYNATNAKLLYFGDTWIRSIPENLEKTKNISFITSNKNFCSGHKLRLKVADQLKDRFDIFGRGFNEIAKKEEGLNNYMFSIAIENQVMVNWFTEKIVDCFKTKTIPIYNGCPNISDFYDERGIIKFEDVAELREILYDLDIVKYNAMLPYIENNFNKANGELSYNKRVEIEIKKYL